MYNEKRPIPPRDAEEKEQNKEQVEQKHPLPPQPDDDGDDKQPLAKLNDDPTIII